MTGRRAAAAVVAASLLPCCLSAVQTSSPTFIWGSGDYTVHGTDGSPGKTFYQDFTAGSVVEAVLNALDDSQEATLAPTQLLNVTAVRADKRQLVTAFVLGRLQLQDLSPLSSTEVLLPLKSVLQRAGSTISLPNVMHQGPSTPVLVSNRLASISTSAGLDTVDGCLDGRRSRAAKASLETLKGETVIVLCPREDSLDNELGVLVDIQAALDRRGKPYLMVYMGEPSAYQMDRGAARSLLQSSEQQNAYLCSDKCFSQVRLLEALILTVTALVALLTGCCMLHILDTPTRFETDKKEATRHDQ